MKKVFIDLDVLLDLLFERDNRTYSETSTICIDILLNIDEYELVTSHSIFRTVMDSIMDSHIEDPFKAIEDLKDIVKPLDKFNLDGSLMSAKYLCEKHDYTFQNCIEYLTALQNDVELYITRHAECYPTHEAVKVVTPIKFLERFKGVTNFN